MNIYLAARFTRWNEMASRARELQTRGHTITSRWHNGTHFAKLPFDRTIRSPELSAFADEDLFDIDRAQAVILFTEHGPRIGGGPHVEAGYALGQKKRLYILGPRENAFYHLPEVFQFNDWQSLLTCLDSAPLCLCG
jgi:hypothetical protein